MVASSSSEGAQRNSSSNRGRHHHAPKHGNGGTYDCKVVTLLLDKAPFGVIVEVIGAAVDSSQSSFSAIVGERVLVRATSSVVVPSLRVGEVVRVTDINSDSRGRSEGKLARALARCEEKTGEVADVDPLPSGRRLIILDLNGVLCDRGPYKARSRLTVRPFALDFVSWCFEHFDVAVWSCGKRENMEMQLFDGRSLVFVWDQAKSTSLWPRTSEVSADKPLFLKEIDKVFSAVFEHEVATPPTNSWRKVAAGPERKKIRWRYGPGDTLLLDNHSEKFERNPKQNCVVVQTWDPSNRNDATLSLRGELVTNLAKFFKDGSFPPPQVDPPGTLFAQTYCSSPVHARYCRDYPASRYVDQRDSPGPRALPLRRLDLKTLSEHRYLATEKTDGQRGWFYACPEKSSSFLLNRDLTVAVVLASSSSAEAPLETPTIFDGEMILDQKLFVVFDCVLAQGEDVGASGGGAPQRLEKASTFFKECASFFGDWKFIPKEYWRPDDDSDESSSFRRRLESVLESGEFGDDRRRTKADGLVLIRADDGPAGYYGASCFKHKPTVTIDFRLVDGGHKGAVVEGAISGEGRDLAVAKVRLDIPRQKGTIVECAYDGGVWNVTRPRPDKKRPNPIRTAWSALESCIDPIKVSDLVDAMCVPYGNDVAVAAAAEHYDKIQERRNASSRSAQSSSTTTDASGMHRLRRLNNFVKALTIERFAARRPPSAGDGGNDESEERSIRVFEKLTKPVVRRGGRRGNGKKKTSAAVLELGCGRGGDLGKWRSSFDTKIVAIDASSISLKEAHKRWGNKDTGVFQVGDMSDSSTIVRSAAAKLGQPETSWADFCACQFALHYACGSESRLDSCLAAVSEALKDGGVFFATVVEWRRLRELLGTKARSIDDLCKVDASKDTVDSLKRLGDDESTTALGLKYTFSLGDAVEDCDEFVVHTPTLAAIAKNKHNLDLIAAIPFPALLADELRLNPDSFLALAADIGVTPNPPGKRNDHPPLSQSQFQVSGLYQAIAFVKR